MITTETNHPPIIQYLPGPELGHPQVDLTDSALMTTDDVIAIAVSGLLDPHKQNPDLCSSSVICSHSAQYFIVMNDSGRVMQIESDEYESLEALEQVGGSILLPYTDETRTSVMLDGKVVPVNELVKIIDSSYFDGLTADIPGGNFTFVLCGSAVFALLASGWMAIGGGSISSMGKTRVANQVQQTAPQDVEKDGFVIAMQGDVYPAYTGKEPNREQVQAALDQANLEQIQRFQVKGIIDGDGEGHEKDEGFAGLLGFQNDSIPLSGQVIGPDHPKLGVFNNFIEVSSAYKDGWRKNQHE